MTPKPAALLLSFLAAFASAQTTAHPAAAAHTASAAHRSAGTSAARGGCVPLPPMSPKIPALSGSECFKPLYTLTRKPDIILDYASPMLSPALRKALSPEPMVVSLLYIDTQVGTGELARPGKFYTVHYTGYLLNGTKFDSSRDAGKPITFPYGAHRVIAGWDTGFEGMRVGGKRRLYVPYQLAYGDNGKGQIPGRADLVFDVELVAQHDTDPDAGKVPPPPPAGAQGTPQPAPEARPSQSPAGPAGTPPVNPSTPASSTQPAAKPEAK